MDRITNIVWKTIGGISLGGIPSIPAVLRLSARRALALIDGKELAQ